MNKFLTRIAGVALSLAMAIGVGVSIANGVKDAVPAHAATTVKWTRVKSVTTLLEGGTFIMGYEVSSDAPNVIVPLRSDGANAKTTANGYFYTGTTSGKSDNGTIDMSEIETTSAYEVYITASTNTSGAINIQMGNSTGDFYGATDGGTTKNSGRLYSSGNATETDIIPTISKSGDHFSLKVEVTGDYCYLKYNTSNPRYAFYNASASDTVFYKQSLETSTTPSISVTSSSEKIAVGDTADVTINYSDLESDLKVSVDDSSVATATLNSSVSSGSGTVTLTITGVKEGSTTITISSTDATSKSISVEVVNPVIYEKVTSVNAIKAGREFIIGTTDGTYVLSKYSTGNNCKSLAYTPTDGKIVSTTLNADCAIFTLGGETDKWTLTDQDNNIYYGTSGNNYLKASLTATDTWKISINEGVATITSNASSRSIKKNSSSELFSTYSNGQLDISIYMVPSTDPELQLSITEGSKSLGVGETATVTASKINIDSGTVNWSSSDSNILSLSAAKGDSIIVTAGTTLGTATLTASLEGCDDVELVFTVRKGSLSKPYSVDEAIEAIKGSDEDAKTNVYTSGIISKVDSLNTDNSITYWISNNGTTTASQLEVYKGFGLNGGTFSAVEDLQVGDVVTIVGNLTLYSTDTYEYDSGSKITSFSRPDNVLASIVSINGTLSAENGDESWDLSSLTVTGKFSGSEEEVDVTAYVTLSTEDVPGSHSETTVKDVSVTATGIDDNSISYTGTVSGTIIVYTGPISNGRYYIMATYNDVEYGLNASSSSSSSPTAIDLSDSNELTAFDIKLKNDNLYEISTTIYDEETDTENTYYLVCNSTATSSSNSSIRITSSPLAGLASTSWELDPLSDGDEGLFNVKINTFGETYRYLSLYNGSDWRGYVNTSNGVPKIKFVEEGSYANNIAKALLNDIECDNGVNPPSTSTWATIAESYSKVTIKYEKELLINGVANENSTNLVEQALARYDYIIAKYGTTNYSNFLERSVTVLSSSKVFSSSYLNNDSGAMLILIIASLAGIISLSAIYYVRKRKEQ
ncbi:MAG: hypothetical protein ACI31G_02860 [Bacilli bacterium]